MITADPNPIRFILYYEENDIPKNYVIENHNTEDDVAFQIAYNTLLRYGGEHCVKQWIGMNCTYLDVLIDIRVGDQVISI